MPLLLESLAEYRAEQPVTRLSQPLARQPPHLRRAITAAVAPPRSVPAPAPVPPATTTATDAKVMPQPARPRATMAVTAPPHRCGADPYRAVPAATTS